MNNTPPEKREFNHTIKGKISTLGERLRIAIAPTSQRTFAKTWKGSLVTLNRYITGKSTPNIQDLTEIAELTNTDLLWLLTGQYYSQNHSHWLSSNQSIEVCPDNSMAPTISAQTPVLLEIVDTTQPIHNGVYCIENSQGAVFRRLQWDEDKQGFWLRCDNRHFEPEFTQAPAIVGKVISALTPII